MQKQSITVGRPEGKGRVKIQASQGCAGVWVGNDRGQIGLVAEDGQPPYLVIYGAHPSTGLPPIAIGLDEDTEEPMIQVRDQKGVTGNVRQVSLSRLLLLLGTVAPTPPQ